IRFASPCPSCVPPLVACLMNQPVCSKTKSRTACGGVCLSRGGMHSTVAQCTQRTPAREEPGRGHGRLWRTANHSEDTIMRLIRPLRLVVCAVLLCLSLPALASAHGFAGQRFFPTTLAIDDPFVSDELFFLFRHIKDPGEESPTVSTEIAAEYTKRLTPRLGLSLGGTFRHLDPDEGSTENGFGNLEVGAKYQVFTSA